MPIRVPSSLILVLLCCAAIGTSPACGEDAAEEDPRNAPSLSEAQAVAIAKINAILDAKTTLDVIECPLGDVCEHLETTCGLKIRLDAANLKLARVSKDTLITLYVPEKEKLPLRGVLAKLLKPHGLTFLVRTDGLLITK